MTQTQGTQYETHRVERLAGKRAGMKLGVYVHVVVYVLVNLLLWFKASGAGLSWNLWPLTGWGIGLLAHAALVYANLPGVDGRRGMRAWLVGRELKAMGVVMDVPKDARE